MRVLLLAVLFLCAPVLRGCGGSSSNAVPDTRREEIRALASSIRSWASVCKGEASKGGCDQGDNTLWNGLLCASGEAWACDAVRKMQEPEGWVRRSGSRVGDTTELNPTSRDMTLGFALYVQQTGDRAAAERLLAYVKRTGRLAPRCDHRCVPSPLVLNSLRVAGGIGEGRVVDHLFVQQNAKAAPAGYPRHLAMVQIWIRKRAGWGGPLLEDGAKHLVKQEPENAFFRFVAGDREAAAERWLKYAPRIKPSATTQHSFERTDSSEAWRKSYGWEFVMLANLLTK